MYYIFFSIWKLLNCFFRLPFIFFVGQSCRKGSDVIFLLHSSPSINKADFERHLNFVTTIIPTLNLNNGITKLGFLYYTDPNTKVLYNLNSFANARTATEAISQVDYVRSSGVRLSDAIEEVQVTMFTGSSGDRQGNPNVVVLVSNGEYRQDNTVLTRVSFFNVLTINLSQNSDKQQELTNRHQTITKFLFYKEERKNIGDRDYRNIRRLY